MREDRDAAGLVEAVDAGVVQAPALEVEAGDVGRARVREEQRDLLGLVQPRLAAGGGAIKFPPPSALAQSLCQVPRSAAVSYDRLYIS